MKVLRDGKIIEIETPLNETARLQAKRAKMYATPWKFTRALIFFNLLDPIEAFIATQDRETQEGWKRTTIFWRLDTFLTEKAAEMGMTDEQIDAVFEKAATY